MKMLIISFFKENISSAAWRYIYWCVFLVASWVGWVQGRKFTGSIIFVWSRQLSGEFFIRGPSPHAAFVLSTFTVLLVVEKPILAAPAWLARLEHLWLEVSHILMRTRRILLTISFLLPMTMKVFVNSGSHIFGSWVGYIFCILLWDANCIHG